MPGKKVSHLSQHTLNRLWGWCLANDKDPMSIAFFGACYACQSMQCAKMGDRLRESWPKPGEGDKWGGWLRAAYALGDDVHAYRDALGGEIIDMLKREGVWDASPAGNVEGNAP